MNPVDLNRLDSKLCRWEFPHKEFGSNELPTLIEPTRPVPRNFAVSDVTGTVHQNDRQKIERSIP
ncbi:MAG: hypothetical protein CMM05_04215 [Rhodopirellula sp.]|nr:hypothetical protein [Rhodopirellula sp.]